MHLGHPYPHLYYNHMDSKPPRVQMDSSTSHDLAMDYTWQSIHPQEIIHVEWGALSMMRETLFCVVNLINWIQSMFSPRVTHKIFQAFMQMMTKKHVEGSWYSQI